jgi:membrane-associated phospholipid phosphatase
MSLHASGVGILTGFIFAFCLTQVVYQFWIIVAVIVVSALVISSRLYLKKHTPIELFLGYIISIFVTFFVTYFYPN